MKLIENNESNEKQFTPFNLNLKVETKEEAEFLHHIFNSPPFLKKLNLSDSDCLRIRNYIEHKLDYYPSTYHLFNNLITSYAKILNK